ncbi:hypothetical protein HN51_040527, partial [Arachis hypogaea]
MFLNSKWSVQSPITALFHFLKISIVHKYSNGRTNQGQQDFTFRNQRRNGGPFSVCL